MKPPGHMKACTSWLHVVINFEEPTGSSAHFCLAAEPTSRIQRVPHTTFLTRQTREAPLNTSHQLTISDQQCRPQEPDWHVTDAERRNADAMDSSLVAIARTLLMPVHTMSHRQEAKT